LSEPFPFASNRNRSLLGEPRSQSVPARDRQTSRYRRVDRSNKIGLTPRDSGVDSRISSQWVRHDRTQNSPPRRGQPDSRAGGKPFLDFKACAVSPARLSEAISAFANTAGGELFIGISQVNNKKVNQWDGFHAYEDSNGIFVYIQSVNAWPAPIRMYG
jgi:Putative DNA-binding domain